MTNRQTSSRVSGDVFLLVLGLPFAAGMLGVIAMTESLFGMPSAWVVAVALILGAVTTAVIAIVQRRAAAMMLFPLLSFGWFVILLLGLFLMAGQFNRYGRPQEERETSQQFRDDVVSEQKPAAGEAQV